MLACVTAVQRADSGTIFVETTTELRVIPTFLLRKFCLCYVFYLIYLCLRHVQVD